MQKTISTRLLRKGALIEETYMAFQSWNLEKNFTENLSTLRESNIFGAKSQKWLLEITRTLSNRFNGQNDLSPLIFLTKSRIGIEKWKPCLLWHLASRDVLYRRFALDWLYPAFKKGVYRIRTEDVVPFVKEITNGKIASGGTLSEYGVVRAARDLLLMASNFELLSGSAIRQFCHYHLAEEGFLYILYALAEREHNPQNILESDDWHLFFMSSQDVERELFELHQFKKVDFEMAGSIIRLKLPRKSLREYVERLVRHD